MLLIFDCVNGNLLEKVLKKSFQIKLVNLKANQIWFKAFEHHTLSERILYQPKLTSEIIFFFYIIFYPEQKEEVEEEENCKLS